MQSPSFESLISPPWPEKQESKNDYSPYPLKKPQKHQQSRTEDDDNDDCDHVAELGYN
jgi:hypothetical protein